MPVFIVGIPRSGTTLMRLLLNSHPAIAIPDETGILEQLYDGPGCPLSLPRLIKYAPRTRTAEALGTEIVDAYRSLSLLSKPWTCRGTIRWLFSAYARSHGKLYWGEKTPLHTDYVEDIARLFPKGSILYMVRDPRAVVASYMRYRSSPHRSADDYFISDTLSEAVGKYKRFMKSSLRSKSLVRLRNVTFVSYEKLVSEPENTLRCICQETLNINYSREMLDYTSNARQMLYSQASRMGGKLREWKSGNLRAIDKGLVGRWRNELSETETQYLKAELAAHLEWNSEVLQNGWQ